MQGTKDFLTPPSPVLRTVPENGEVLRSHLSRRTEYLTRHLGHDRRSENEPIRPSPFSDLHCRTEIKDDFAKLRLCSRKTLAEQSMQKHAGVDPKIDHGRPSGPPCYFTIKNDNGFAPTTGGFSERSKVIRRLLRLFVSNKLYNPRDIGDETTEAEKPYLPLPETEHFY